MALLTLADLLTPKTEAVIRSALITALQGQGFPTDDWAPSASGGVENSIVDMAATVLADRAGAEIPTLVAFRLLEKSSGDPLRYLAKHFYQLDPQEASFTIQNIALTMASSAQAQTFGAGDLVVVGAGGNHYRSIEDASLQPGVTTNVQFEADEAGSAFNDADGTITRMVTAPAGVTCVNQRPVDYLPQHQTGTSSGIVTAAFAFETGPADIPPDSLRIRIDVEGDVGTAAFSLSVDGGLSWEPSLPTAPLVGLPAHFVELAFANGDTPSFAAGDILTLLRGSAILQQGRDAEEDDALKARCRAKWTTLSDVPVGQAVTLWAHLASTEVRKVLVDADAVTPGGISVTIASASGPASAAAVLAVQDYIGARLNYKTLAGIGGGVNSAEERVFVKSAAKREVLPAAVVFVPRAQLAAVKTAAEANWTAYLASIDIAGAVELAELIQAIMDAGARSVDVSSVKLNGVAANLALGALEVPVAKAGTTLATALTWRPV